MSKPLAELRKSPDVKPHERVRWVCLAGALVAEMQSILNEAGTLEAERAAIQGVTDDPEKPKRPRRLANTPRLTEIGERLTELEAQRAALRPRIEEHGGNLRLRAWEPGRWRRFLDEHPPRAEHWRDDQLGGLVNADALLQALGDFVVAFEDEPLGKDDWDGWMRAGIAPGDLNDLCRGVLSMQEVGSDIPKALGVSLTTSRNESDAS